MALSSPPIPPVIGDIVANRKVDIATGYVNVNSLLAATVGLPHCYARPNSRISILDVSHEPLYTWHSDEDGLSTRLFILPLLPEIGFVVANKTFDIATG